MPLPQRPKKRSLATYAKLVEKLNAFSETKKHTQEVKLAQTDLYYLVRYILDRPDAEHEWIVQRCADIETSPDEHLDLWARGHYKSTLLTFAKTIQDLLVNPDLTVGIFSHTRPNAKAFLRQIKRELEQNERLKKLFPHVLWQNPKREAPKWSEDDGLILKRSKNPKESSIEAWGLVDGQPVGRHFSLLVYDDVVTREAVTTPEMITKTNQCLELSFALGTHSAKRRFIGTRYHFNDSYRTLMARGSAHVRLHAATADGTPQGTPVLLKPEELNRYRRDMGPYTFACQMLQNPVADEAQGFKRDWLRFYDGAPPQGLTSIVLVDPATSKRAGADYTAVWVVGLARDDTFYVQDMVRDRLNLSQRVQLVLNMIHKWQPPVLGGIRYEQYGLQADIEHLRSKLLEAGLGHEIVPVGGGVAKTDRIRRLLPWFEQGRLWLPRTLHYTGYDGITRDLVGSFIEEEYMPFPVSVHDDMLDALARLAEPGISLPIVTKGAVARSFRQTTNSTSGWMG